MYYLPCSWLSACLWGAYLIPVQEFWLRILTAVSPSLSEIAGNTKISLFIIWGLLSLARKGIYRTWRFNKMPSWLQLTEMSLDSEILQNKVLMLIYTEFNSFLLKLCPSTFYSLLNLDTERTYILTYNMNTFYQVTLYKEVPSYILLQLQTFEMKYMCKAESLLQTKEWIRVTALPSQIILQPWNKAEKKSSFKTALLS